MPYVCKSQAWSWEHPLVKEVEEALAQPIDGALLGYAYSIFKAKVRDIISTTGLMTPFLPMPFTADSEQGKRLTEVLAKLKEEFPQNEMIQTFFWRFWDLERDERQAHFMFGAIQQKPVLVGAHVA